MAQLRAELLKQTSTRTDLGLFAGLLGLVLLAIVLHGLGLRAEELGQRKNQLMILGRGEFLAALFAALLGAMSITAEIRHGTIRPIFVVTPQRGRVIAAKVGVSVVIGAAFGLVASAFAAGVGIAVLRARGIDVQLDAGDYLLLILAAGSRPRCGRLSASAWVPSCATRCRRSSALPLGCCSSRACWAAISAISADLPPVRWAWPQAARSPTRSCRLRSACCCLPFMPWFAVGAAWLATTRRDVP